MSTQNCPKCFFLNPADAANCSRCGADLRTAAEKGFFPEQVVGGRYRLVRRIGEGGMGEVWEAEDAALRRRVALKLVLPDRVDEQSLAPFARQARAGGRLSHPNLVTTLGHGTDGGLTWISQELVEGSWTVKDSINALRADENVPKGYYREVAELVARVADGLADKRSSRAREMTRGRAE